MASPSLRIALCMGCEGAVIEVFKVTLIGEETGYYDKEINGVIEMLKECETGEGYTVTKEQMRVWTYRQLPEFDGF